MGFGGPGGRQIAYKPTPPERGSFPLDHDGECKPIVADYLRCLRRVRGTNDQECRMIAKGYLKCRMDNNLMALDEFKNLGFAEEKKPSISEAMATKSVPVDGGEATAQKSTKDGNKAS